MGLRLGLGFGFGFEFEFGFEFGFEFEFEFEKNQFAYRIRTYSRISSYSPVNNKFLFHILAFIF